MIVLDSHGWQPVTIFCLSSVRVRCSLSTACARKISIFLIRSLSMFAPVQFRQSKPGLAVGDLSRMMSQASQSKLCSELVRLTRRANRALTVGLNMGFPTAFINPGPPECHFLCWPLDRSLRALLSCKRKSSTGNNTNGGFDDRFHLIYRSDAARSSCD